MKEQVFDQCLASGNAPYVDRSHGTSWRIVCYSSASKQKLSGFVHGHQTPDVNFVREIVLSLLRPQPKATNSSSTAPTPEALKYTASWGVLTFEDALSSPTTASYKHPCTEPDTLTGSHIPNMANAKDSAKDRKVKPEFQCPDVCTRR